MDTYGDAGFLEIEPHGERLSHEHVRIVTGLERPLQLFELPGAKIGPRTPSFTGRIVQIGICSNEFTTLENMASNSDGTILLQEARSTKIDGKSPSLSSKGEAKKVLQLNQFSWRPPSLCSFLWYQGMSA